MIKQSKTKRQVKFDSNKVQLNTFSVKFNLIAMSESFGSWLKLLRDKLGYSQQEVADRAKVTKSTISLLENDKIELPRLDGLDRIAKVLGVSTEEMRRNLAVRMIMKDSQFVPPPILEAIAQSGNLSDEDYELAANFIKMLNDQKK